MTSYITTIRWNNAHVEVSYDYWPPDKGVHTYPNGDPGYPPSPAEIEITKVEYNGQDVTDLFDDDDFCKMEEKIGESTNPIAYEFD